MERERERERERPFMERETLDERWRERKEREKPLSYKLTHDCITMSQQ